MANLDYISVSSDEIFPSGSSDNTDKCVNISIVDDMAFEDDEDFIITLSTSDPNVLISVDEISVTIIDDIDSKLLV